MKNLTNILLALLLISSIPATAQVYKTTSGNAKFFSTAPLEDIEATSKKMVCKLTTSTNAVAFGVSIRSFQFDKEKMREHFNENYMESDKYKLAKFIGKIQDTLDYTKDGTYNVTVKGKLTIHGVTKDRTVQGQVIIKDGKIQLKSTFDVKLEDHNIDIPKMVFQKIAETVEVTIDCTLDKV